MLTLKAIAQKLGEEKIRELYERALDDDVDIFAVAEEEAARHRIELSPVDMSQKERRGIEMGGMVLAFMVIDGNYEPELFPRVLYIMLTIFSDGYGEVSTR